MGTAKRDRQRLNRQLGRDVLQKQQRRTSVKKRVLQFAIGIPVLVALGFLLVWLVGGDSDDSISSGSTLTGDSETTASGGPSASTITLAGAAITGETPCPSTSGEVGRTGTFEQAPPECIDPTKTYTAVVTTDHGEFTIELAASASPINVNNFVVLSRYRYYDGTACHRIGAEFVVQCGRPGDDESAPGYSVADELPAAGSYTEGVVAVANTGSPNSGGGQFFVITGDSGAALPPDYTILGRVVEGYDTTINALEALAPADGSAGPPVEPVSILGVTITESGGDGDQPTTTSSSADSSTTTSPT